MVMSTQATQIDLRWRTGVLAGGLCAALALAGCTAPPDAVAPASAVQTPASTTTTSAVAPDPPTTPLRRRIPLPRVAAVAPDPTTAGPTTVRHDRPLWRRIPLLRPVRRPILATTSTTTGQGGGPVSGGEGKATRDEGAETGLGETEGKPGEPAPPGRRGEGADLGPVEGRVYEWLDGDRTRRVWLQTDLVLEERGQAPDNQVVLRFGGDQDIVNREGRHDGVGTQPVFRSESGDVMTLPGGVLLVLDPTWDDQAVKAFFAAHGIPKSRVEEQAFAANAFLVDTPPGLPSLELANRLAGEDGVVVSSPNWATAVFPR